MVRYLQGWANNESAGASSSAAEIHLHIDCSSAEYSQNRARHSAFHRPHMLGRNREIVDCGEVEGRLPWARKDVCGSQDGLGSECYRSED